MSLTAATIVILGMITSFLAGAGVYHWARIKSTKVTLIRDPVADARFEAEEEEREKSHPSLRTQRKT